MAERMGRISTTEVRNGWAVLDELWRVVDVIELDQTLMSEAARLSVLHGLRGYDATHCAAAVAANDVGSLPHRETVGCSPPGGQKASPCATRRLLEGGTIALTSCPISNIMSTKRRVLHQSTGRVRSQTSIPNSHERVPAPVVLRRITSVATAQAGRCLGRALQHRPTASSPGPATAGDTGATLHPHATDRRDDLP